MAQNFDMTAQLAGNFVRFGWYWSINWLAAREAARHGEPPRYRPTRAIPSYSVLMEDVIKLLIRDAEAVREGINPPVEGSPKSFARHLSRVRNMFEDLPDTMRRRRESETSGAQAFANDEVPDYLKQDFHFQSGGHLSRQSAQLYDVQVETLFYGVAGAMRRAALRPLAAFMKGKNQRNVALLDVACGTGRLLREIRLAYPVIQARGIDLSEAYLEEARRHLSEVRPVTLTAANAEGMPFPDASQDVVATCYLYHELPPDARRQVTSEISRVLKPGGLFLFIDSLQLGDRPGWDGLIEAFPHRFHEPYYDHYTQDDLKSLFEKHELEVEECMTAFLSKIVVCKKMNERRHFRRQPF